MRNRNLFESAIIYSIWSNPQCVRCAVYKNKLINVPYLKFKANSQVNLLRPYWESRNRTVTERTRIQLHWNSSHHRPIKGCSSQHYHKDGLSSQGLSAISMTISCNTGPLTISPYPTVQGTCLCRYPSQGHLVLPATGWPAPPSTDFSDGRNHKVLTYSSHACVYTWASSI